MRRHHEVSDLHFEDDEMVLTIDGHVRIFGYIVLLLNATSIERNTYEVSPSDMAFTGR